MLDHNAQLHVGEEQTQHISTNTSDQLASMGGRPMTGWFTDTLRDPRFPVKSSPLQTAWSKLGHQQNNDPKHSWSTEWLKKRRELCRTEASMEGGVDQKFSKQLRKFWKLLDQGVPTGTSSSCGDRATVGPTGLGHQELLVIPESLPNQPWASSQSQNSDLLPPHPPGSVCSVGPQSQQHHRQSAGFQPRGRDPVSFPVCVCVPTRPFLLQNRPGCGHCTPSDPDFNPIRVQIMGLTPAQPLHPELNQNTEAQWS
ncbi:hypothetical protein CRENBAI_009337 [Crenichthys baileyi]|uniref:Uncharacterized protein n=1 Tax=Crenichthys baileyi TaxID=28760 RepID=A0AAV9RMN4_9TELE